jgi:type III pantothenate kinase
MMSSGAMYLAIDIGNSNVVFGVFKGDAIIARFRVSTNLKSTSDEYGTLVLSLLKHNGVDAYAIKAIIVGSVVPGLDRVFRELCARYLKKTALFVNSDVKVPLQIALASPHEVGADRLINVYRAWKLHKSAAIVIDFGTATTFDVVSKVGHFLGGAIAPGMEISGKALFESTSKLNRVDLTPPERAIGKNTKEAIQSGLFLGYVGLIDFLVKRMKAELGESARVIATGGLAAPFLGLSTEIEEVDPDLTLCGLNMLLSEKDSL